MQVLTAAIMRVPRNNSSPVPNEKQVSSYEAAESNVRCPLLELETVLILSGLLGCGTHGYFRASSRK
jgi:hypothetical protein